MLSTGSMPRQLGRVVAVGSRFQKFLVVGVFGLAVNQGALFALVSWADMKIAVASPIAIVLSMIVTFALNERWTWHDRGSGSILNRALLYGSINSGGLLINWGVLVALHLAGVNYLVANLIGAGVAAIWNFSLNNTVTWRR